MGKTDFIKPLIDDAVRGILDLLGSGRADEVTEGMLDLGDPVLNARLNEALWQNYDLPMDTASRMERAKAMGFGVETYRGDKRDILGLTRFDGQAEGGPGVLFSSDAARVANTYAPRMPNPSGENVIPLLMRSNGYREAGYIKPFPAEGTEAEMDAWMRGLDAFDKRIAQPGAKNAIFEREISAARDAAQPGIVFRQVVDDRIDTGSRLPSDVYAALDPASLRSKFARFDPRLAHLRNLNAALAGGAGVTGLLSMTPEEAAAAEIEAYLQGKR